MNTENPNKEKSEDKRKRFNDNPDRPPIDPESPNTPAPYDPFNTAQITDGGVVQQDETELVFEQHLQIATVKPDTIGEISQQTPESYQEEKRCETEPGTLIHITKTIFTETNTQGWTYQLMADNSKMGSQHIILSNGEPYGALKLIDGTYVVGLHDQLTNTTNTTNFSSFNNAFSALIEAIDWGSPPTTNHEQIWKYEGYTKTNQNFSEYLDGNDNSQCGNHILHNTIAEYAVHIESYQETQNLQGRTRTVAVMTVKKKEQNGSEYPIYRESYPGQRQAFEKLIACLNNGLSIEIDTFTGPIGDQLTVPSIKELL